MNGRARAREILGLVVLSATTAAAAPGAQPAPTAPAVTPLEGPSWLKRLGLSRALSAMGQMGTVGNRPATVTSERWHDPPPVPERLDRPFTLTGADLYRINCESCHNVEGIGTPPEIRSLVNAVRATSPRVIRDQMKARGLSLDAATVAEMAGQAEAALRERLQKGGEKMPRFDHLSRAEVDALLNYLKSLAAVPGERGRPVRVTVPLLRVGEHLVKGTCFICHDATGPGRDAIAATPGLIPSLASFPQQNPVMQVVHKVREGAQAPGAMGLRGEMPVFTYLTAEEVTAAYLYLAAYPPRP